MSGGVEQKTLNMSSMSPHQSFPETFKGRDFAMISGRIPLTHADISKALLDSTDDGKTLDFSHKNLTDVGEPGAEELARIGIEGLADECIVSRVALGYNRLATLPMAFALLTRLRYLNLRANCFTVFPDVLTVLPSLEVLDISRNKLKRLPSQPGTLLSLRVLCLSKNRIARLPPYISRASNLTLLQLDHNPLEWPPKSIWEPLEQAQDASIMALRIDAVRQWISNHSSDMEIGENDVDLNEGVINSQHLEIDYASEDIDAQAQSPEEALQPTRLRHSRSFSIASNISQYSSASHESDASDMSFYATSDNEVSSMDSISSELISPPITNGLMARKVRQSKYNESISLEELSERFPPPPLSLEVSSRPLKVKKSSPDFPSKFNLPPFPRERYGLLRSRAYTSDGSMQSSESEILHPLNKQTSHRHAASFQDTEDLPTSSHLYLSRLTSNSNGKTTISISNTSHTVAPPMDVERNSYFRRFSALPPSTIQATMPEPLVAMVESARGILFAVSQIYQSLRHYIVFAIDDRLSGLLSKVLEPASKYMSHLISALDRFDAISRRSIPPSHICRNVLESCKDNVAVFGKVIGVLHIQLTVLAGADDARYSRSLLLMLYGSMAEISHSWQTMTPHFESLMPHLKDIRIPPPASKGSTQTTPLTPLNHGGTPLSQMAPSPTPRTPASASSISNGRVRLNRRHAGSFSSKDVETGKAMLSEFPTETPAPATAPLRSALRKPSLPQSVQGTSSTDSLSDTPHQRGAASSPAVINTTSTSTPSFTFPSPKRQGSSGNKFGNFLETPTGSKLVDENLLDTMEAATGTAGSVWQMLDDVLRVGDKNSELPEALQTAQDVTNRLAEKVRNIREKALEGNRKAFWEDAHTFVKLRSSIAKLTQSTQDFAILLQVSSFSPAPTPSLYSSAQTPVIPSKLSGSTIARSRSAQASQPAKFKSNEREPWSALPNQTVF
ncbi:hypothetical protein Clacol_006322 [Clathrus columnatus]|uniref:Uncharacterized protein n=1 Tax=Clathrus columnatus TaxID=1419009 RepID=A0AAV5AHW7_9AGAM|nr:hypothetical protein Clacol_006322 [Clathrus columnatus]